MNTKIKAIRARQVLDCKARPMLEADVYTEDGFMGRGSAPTGTSVGQFESYVLRDGNSSDYHGLSVHSAVKVVEEVLAPALIGIDVEDLAAIDRTMIALDGTPNKSKLGGNSIYSVSIACLRAAAVCRKIPVYQYLAGGPLHTVPLPTFNVINGGKNGGITQAFNEFMLAPYGAESLEEAVAIGVEVYQKLKDIIARFQGGKEPLLGGSYGWAAPSSDPRVVLQIMAEAVAACGHTQKMAYCLDCASSEMYDAMTKTYELNGRRVPPAELIDFVRGLTEEFPLIFVEDLLDENDWDHFVTAHREIKKTQLIGDDFIVTNLDRLKKAYVLQAVDGFILKPNQVGTITEALETFRFAQEHYLLTIPSGRSGGTVGDIVADLSLGLSCPVSKNGAPKSGERLDKINSLLRASSENPGCGLADFSEIIRF